MCNSLTEKGLHRWIGSKDFYKKVFVIVLPIVVQNTISNFVNLLDNIMVGQTGTNAMNGVSIVNQLMFVFTLCIWGSVSGAGIFTAQYYGKGDDEGVRNTFRAKMILVSLVTIIGIFLLLLKGEFLIARFLHETDGIGNAAETMEHGLNYLHIMLVGLIPLAVSMAYSNTLRDIGQTKTPMIAGVTAVFVNLFFNWLLIFGNLGCPEMGVEGAAVATVISRFVECSINAGWTQAHRNSKDRQYTWVKGAYRTLKIPPELMGRILVKGAPLALNEALWALGLTVLNQNYSLKGLSVVAALNIVSTISNMCNVFFFAIGESISIIAGQLLGANKNEEARSTVRKMLALSVSVCVIIGIGMFLLRNLFPAIYKTEKEVQLLAANFITVVACLMPLHALLHGCYFTLRCGGKTLITFLFDSFFVWVCSVSVCFVLTHFTELNIMQIYITVSLLDMIKAVIGVVLVKKGIWINNIVD